MKEDWSLDVGKKTKYFVKLERLLKVSKVLKININFDGEKLKIIWPFLSKQIKFTPLQIFFLMRQLKLGVDDKETVKQLNKKVVETPKRKDLVNRKIDEKKESHTVVSQTGLAINLREEKYDPEKLQLINWSAFDRYDAFDQLTTFWGLTQKQRIYYYQFEIDKLNIEQIMMKNLIKTKEPIIRSLIKVANTPLPVDIVRLSSQLTKQPLTPRLILQLYHILKLNSFNLKNIQIQSIYRNKYKKEVENINVKLSKTGFFLRLAKIYYELWNKAISFNVHLSTIPDSFKKCLIWNKMFGVAKRRSLEGLPYKSKVENSSKTIAALTI